MRLSGIVKYSRNYRLLGATLLILTVALINYLLFYDILGCSVWRIRPHAGTWSTALTVLLLLSQLAFGSAFIHLVTKVVAPPKRDYSKALFVSSAIILLFSFYYTFFPYQGPFIYILGIVIPYPPSTWVVLILWTILAIFAAAKIFCITYRFRCGKRELLTAAVSFALAMAIAS